MVVKFLVRVISNKFLKLQFHIVKWKYTIQIQIILLEGTLSPTFDHRNKEITESTFTLKEPTQIY